MRTSLPTPRSRKPTSAADRGVPRWWSAAVALLAFLLYLALCPPVSGDKDSAEFTIVLALPGVAHPTGYPLFTLFGHAWVTVVHALGATWAWAANAWTALGGAVAIYFLQRFALALIAAERLSRRARFGLSTLPVLAFALNPTWTYETTLAEVNAWHVAWALGAATLYLLLARKEKPDLRDTAVWGFVCGIGAAHHATSVFVVVPLSGALIGRFMRTLTPAHVLAAVLAACVPLASYAYIPWRAAQEGAHAWPMLRPGWAGLIDHVTGRQYAGRLGSFTPARQQLELLEWYVWPFLFPGLVLLVVHARRARDYAIAGSAILGTLYAFSYGVPDPSSYFLQPLAFALAAVPALLAPGLARGRRPARVLAWALGGLFGVLAFAWFGFGAIRSTNMLEFDGVVTSMWRSIPYDRAWVFWNDDMYYKLVERQVLAHEKPGIIVLDASVLEDPEARRKLAARTGIDPVPYPEAARVEEEVNRLSGLPVIDFDPLKRSVQLLRK